MRYSLIGLSLLLAVVRVQGTTGPGNPCEPALGLIGRSLEGYESFRFLYQKAYELSKRAHAEQNQLYAEHPYTYHLDAVEEVLRRFGYDATGSVQARRLFIAARLHDVVEDTPVTLEQIGELFGSDIAALVDSVTKEKSKTETLLKIKKDPDGVILKLADRIANVEQGVRSGQIRRKYLEDYPLFRKTLKVDGVADSMWEHLDGLLGYRP